jgi:hypothetical protein
MTIKPTLYWTDKIVMSYLIQAARIHRRMPEGGPSGYHCLWPVMMQTEWESLHDLLNGPPILGPVMPPEVTFQDEVMAWLSILPREQQQLVWMRANQIPWKIMVEELGRSKVSLWRDLNNCFSKLISHLNRLDLEGDHFRQLRYRTLASISFGGTL